MNLIENNSQKIIALCKKHKVGKLFVFGSILTDRFNDDSDVDMVVDFDKVTLEDYADNYFDLKFSLEYSSCLLIFISLGIFTTGGVTIGVAGVF